MKNVEHFLAPRRLGARGVAAVLAMTLASISHGAQTDIAATPIASTTAALVKPNIMLLMDASGSMARTHMPDEVETLMGPTSVGYKSSQCNRLYYDPALTYPRPKMYDGSLFPVQPFGGARYAGFGNFHAVPDLTVKNLNTEFIAYDPHHARGAVAVPRHAPGGLLLRLHRPGNLELRDGPLHAVRHRSDQPDSGRRPVDEGERRLAAGRRTRELRDLVLVLPDADRAHQERGQPGLLAAERHQAHRLHHDAAEGRADRGRHQPASFPARGRLQRRPRRSEGQVVREAVRADPRRRLAGA